MTEQAWATYLEAMASQPQALAGVIQHVEQQLPRAEFILDRASVAFVGIGASHAAAALPTYLLRERGLVALRMGANEVRHSTVHQADALVALSQSGRSRETIDAVSAQCDSPTLAVVNIPDSPLTRLASTTIDLGAQADSKASTIGFTGTLTALGLLADAWLAPRESLLHRAQWQDLPQLVTEVLALRTTVEQVSEQVRTACSVDVIAPPLSLASAEEGALLLREVCRVPSAPWELRTYLHGCEESASPRGGARPTAHVILGGQRSIRLATDLATKGHVVAFLGSSPPSATEQITDAGGLVVTLPSASGAIQVILETVALQMLAGAIAEADEVPPDEFLNSSFDTKVDAVPEIPAGS